MRGRNHLSIVTVLLAVLVLLCCESRALAYIGPGAPLALVPWFIGLVIFVVVAFFMMLLWPIYVLIRWLRGVKAPAAATASAAGTPADNGVKHAPILAAQAAPPSAPEASREASIQQQA